MQAWSDDDVPTRTVPPSRHRSCKGTKHGSSKHTSNEYIAMLSTVLAPAVASAGRVFAEWIVRWIVRLIRELRMRREIRKPQKT